MALWSDYMKITQKTLSDNELSPPLAGGDKACPPSQACSLRRGGRGEGEHPISSKLFCKRSQVEFMPYGVVLKDERRTSNIERPTLNIE
jgi:hypothetical protein